MFCTKRSTYCIGRYYERATFAYDMRYYAQSEYFRNFKWRKTPINLNYLTKYPYYQLLEVGNHYLKPIEYPYYIYLPSYEYAPDIGDDNREIFTLDYAQKLQQYHINDMKKTLKPNYIINELVDNNQQFNKRTIYSKYKYLYKKKRKYMFHIHAYPVSIDTVHRYYFKNEPRSIGFIRWDMLALMLLHGAPYGNVLLAEKTKGLLLGCVLLRGANKVTVVAENTKHWKQLPIVEYLNIDKQRLAGVYFVEWSRYHAPEKKIYENVSKTLVPTTIDYSYKPNTEYYPQLADRPSQHYTNLLVLGNYDFSSILHHTLPTLHQGCIISLYCQSLYPLIEAHTTMQKLHFLNIKLQDSWTRQYQVLKNRTHPLMSMDSASGYLLTAIKV